MSLSCCAINFRPCCTPMEVTFVHPLPPMLLFGIDSLFQIGKRSLFPVHSACYGIQLNMSPFTCSFYTKSVSGMSSARLN
jgi:hypothetical protein